MFYEFGVIILIKVLKFIGLIKVGNKVILLLPDLFQGTRAWRETIEPQKPGNFPGPGPVVVKDVVMSGL